VVSWCLLLDAEEAALNASVGDKYQNKLIGVRQIDQILYDREDTEVMADDGSTVDLLTSLLLQILTVDVTS
jgi:hypothetical protein